jgi:hypothetical protein
VNIIINKTIRFSDINLLNDAQEGHWGYEIFIEAANRILKRESVPDTFPAISEEFISQVDATWSVFGTRLASFVACFSTDGDSLSQWRAYADDGRGFAIGFKAQQLRRLPVQMLDVLYDREKQIEEMVIAVGALFLEFTEEARNSSWLRQESALLAASGLAFKNPAWRDEKEVRCQHIVDIFTSAEEWTMTDAGGVSEGRDVGGQPIGFQVRNGAIVPFLDMPFEVSKQNFPIEEIVFGPKCPTGFGNVWFLLGNNGFGKVPLRSAGAAYR